jgi:hypothetical protein
MFPGGIHTGAREGAPPPLVYIQKIKEGIIQWISRRIDTCQLLLIYIHSTTITKRGCQALKHPCRGVLRFAKTFVCWSVLKPKKK